ncbi:MAG: hypothetical protein KF724_06095 [Phycisphaeraceae bacterium]|nr:hypothetical protein [Phycisphaeraceae bacterium]
MSSKNTIRYGLSRSDYEELFLRTTPIVGGAGAKVSRHRRAREDAKIAASYPKSSGAVISELRARGYDGSNSTLRAAINAGIVSDDRDEDTAQRRWSAEQIDAIANWCEQEGRWTPGATARMFHGIDGAQEIRAQRAALSEHPEAQGDPANLVMELVPGAVSLGVPTLVRYRPLSAAEQRQRLERIGAAVGAPVVFSKGKR